MRDVVQMLTLFDKKGDEFIGFYVLAGMYTGYLYVYTMCSL